MAVAHPPAELSDVLIELETIISSVRLKNTTMINYYIFPDPTPNQIAAFEPRFDALAERRYDLASLSLPNLSLLFDEAPLLIASNLLPIAQQISAAIFRFQAIFIEYYDRTLDKRKPYLQVWQRTKLVEEQLSYFIAFHQQNPHRRPAMALQPPPSTTLPMFCPVAIAFVNGQDRGRIQSCMPTELLSNNKTLLKAEGGVFLWWECMGCAFRLRFHVSNSAAMNINSTTEIRKHEDIDKLEYRSSWLAKCHLYHPGRDEQVRERERRREASMGQGSKHKSSNSVSVNAVGVGGMKYGCPFCFASGKSLVVKETTFRSAWDLADHVASNHTKMLPSPPLLQRLKVGFNGQTAPGVTRWDLNVG